MKILVVDDDPTILKLCATALSKMGHEVEACSAGHQALAAALSERFDLALCDVNLPDVDGLELVRAIKEHAPQLPVIVISALDPREWEPKAGEAGADHFLQKPLKLDLLRHEVNMADRARAKLSVVLQDDDKAHRARLYEALSKGGCQVRVVDAPAHVQSGERPQLVVLDGGSPGAEATVRWCRDQKVHCFVLYDAKGTFDDRLLRMGASLIVQKPVEPEALLIQARFLASR